ncbi:uncharacterized protein [Diadema antillarum]|uniref:uncharacterized protein n=1 Tax=Diadema antillarum TaxID=105358 RepID=UPI003A8A7DFE
MTPELMSPCPSILADGFYIGCYQEECVRNDYRYNFSPESLTSDNCTTLCGESGYLFAAISNGTDCTCGYQFMCFNHSRRLNLTGNCGIPCPGDNERFCGGWGKVLAYIVSSSTKNTGACEQTSAAASVTSSKTLTTDASSQQIELCDCAIHAVFSAAVGSILTLVIFLVVTCCIVRRCKGRRKVDHTTACQTNSGSATFTPQKMEVSELQARTERLSDMEQRASTSSSPDGGLSIQISDTPVSQNLVIEANPDEYQKLHHAYQKQIFVTRNPDEEQEDAFAVLPESCYNRLSEEVPHIYDVLDGDDYRCFLSNESDTLDEKWK